MLKKRRSGAWGCEAFVENAGASDSPRPWRKRLDTPRSHRVNSAMRGKARAESCQITRKMAITSSRATVCVRWGLPIHKKIIGHDMSPSRAGLTGRRVHGMRRVFALLHQPARQHGRSIFFEPLVEQCADLLAQIRGVVQPRQLIALQTIPGSRKQEFPRRLCSISGHVPFSCGDRNCMVTL